MWPNSRMFAASRCQGLEYSSYTVHRRSGLYVKRCGECSNGEFREAVQTQEQADLKRIQDKLQRPLDESEASHSGISQLRSFLERLLQRQYLESVPSILPLLEKEVRTAVRSSALWLSFACILYMGNCHTVVFPKEGQMRLQGKPRGQLSLQYSGQPTTEIGYFWTSRGT
jgi:hypothetical protein